MDGFVDMPETVLVSGWNCGGRLWVGDSFTTAVRFDPPPMGMRSIRLVVERIRAPGRDLDDLAPGASAELTLRVEAPCQLGLGDVLTNHAPVTYHQAAGLAME